MDRNVITATVLITLIMVVWLFWMQPPEQPISQDQFAADSVAQVEAEPPPVVELRERGFRRLADSSFAAVQEGDEQVITVENDLYVARFSTKGGTITSIKLKEYMMFDGLRQIELADTTTPGAIALLFTTPASHAVDSRQLFYRPNTSLDHLDATLGPQQLSFEAEIGSGALRQTYTFKPGSYEIELLVEQKNPDAYATREGYVFVWDGGVPFSEDNTRTEAENSGAFARSGGETERITLLRDEAEEKTLSGSIDWIAVKNQYFTVVVIPDDETRGADLIGTRTFEPGDPNYEEDYEISLLMRPSGEVPQRYRIYAGPMEFFRLAPYKLKLYSMVDFGFKWLEWMVRPLAKFVFIPLFAFLNRFIPNYGIDIILLALLMKIVLYPLTRHSYKNMARMRELQPKMQAIKEKYADNPQKQQEATMKMYRETGVNPLGGCLPMLLQYPVIIALWRFLPNSIEIRQQGFLWASDLSAPDKILNLPFEIPFYGDYVAGFTLLMGLSMVVQMKIQMASTPSNPQMKMFTYLMPVMIFAIFNRFASGLSLYYLCYNVFTAVQQQVMNRSMHKQTEAEAEAAKTNGRGTGAHTKQAKKKATQKRERSTAKKKVKR